jgi:phosphopantetheinyl transferase (holo-ACP synthase)
VIERHGERFLDAHLHRTERARAAAARKSVETYAKRFAAKEACAKALGTGMRAGVWWRDMGVVNLPSGADHEADRRRAGAARRAHAAGLAKRASTSPSPTSIRWRRHS